MSTNIIGSLNLSAEYKLLILYKGEDILPSSDLVEEGDEIHEINFDLSVKNKTEKRNIQYSYTESFNIQDPVADLDLDNTKRLLNENNTLYGFRAFIDNMNGDSVFEGKIVLLKDNIICERRIYYYYGDGTFSSPKSSKELEVCNCSLRYILLEGKLQADETIAIIYKPKSVILKNFYFY